MRNLSKELQDKIKNIKTDIAECICNSKVEKIMMFSGGKDSIVTRHLMENNGVTNISYYYVPSGMETKTFTDFMKNNYGDVKYLPIKRNVTDEWMKRRYLPYPSKGKQDYFNELDKRKNVYCCTEIRWVPRLSDLTKDKNALVIFGLRNIDSKRTGRFNEKWRNKICPILDWTDQDVWSYIKFYNLNIPLDYELYGTTRTCPICPLMFNVTQKKGYKIEQKLLKQLRKISDYCFKNNPFLQEQFITADMYYECIINTKKFRQYVYHDCKYFINPETGIKYSN